MMTQHKLNQIMRRFSSHTGFVGAVMQPALLRTFETALVRNTLLQRYAPRMGRDRRGDCNRRNHTVVIFTGQSTQFPFQSLAMSLRPTSGLEEWNKLRLYLMCSPQLQGRSLR